MVDPRGRTWRVSDLAVSLIRTWVPVAAGALVAWLARRAGVVLDPDTSAQAMPWIVAGTIGGYYLAARWLERRRGERLAARAARLLGRWMLGGVIRQPVYAQPSQRLTLAGETIETEPPRITRRLF
jgi:hypothetical protein